MLDSSNFTLVFNALESKVDVSGLATTGDLSIARYETELMLAPEYNAFTSYAVGDKVVYAHKLYTCTTAITTPESWDSTHWSQVSVASGFVDLDKAQVITGAKTFTAGIGFDYPNATGNWGIKQDGANQLSIYQDTAQTFCFQGGQLFSLTNADLGNNNRKWKDLYLSGTAHIGSNIKYSGGLILGLEGGGNRFGFGEDGLVNYTNKDLGSSAYPWKDLYLSGKAYVGGIYPIGNDNNGFTFTSSSFTWNLNANFAPLSDDTRSLGSSSVRWKDGYFSGQVYAQNTFNVINASDIVNNILTQAQYDLITNGKPTLIMGTLSGQTNIFIPQILSTGATRYGAWFNGIAFGSLSINVSTKVITILGSATKSQYLRSIYSINGKEIPDYPANTGTFVLKCIDGVLTWVAE